MRSQHVAHVQPGCGELSSFGGREGAIDPATETHDAWLIEGRPKLDFGAEMPAHTATHSGVIADADDATYARHDADVESENHPQR